MTLNKGVPTVVKLPQPLHTGLTGGFKNADGFAERVANTAGSFIYNSTTAYEVTDANGNLPIYAIQVAGYPVIEELESGGVDLMAYHGFDSEPNLEAGMLILADSDKPWTLIKFSTAGKVILHRLKLD
jgi:hypothetical protein